MHIHDLEFLPVREVRLANGDEAPAVAVSLYGHWCHLQDRDGGVISIPASAVGLIAWT